MMTSDEMVKYLREKAGAFDYQGWIEIAIDYELAADVIEELLPFKKQVEKGMGLLDKAEELLNAVKPRWIPMTERPPEEELAFYQCYTDAGLVVECLWTNNRTGLGPLGEWGWRFIDVPSHQKITHWMPLPEPPKEKVE